ncbi:MAG: PA14 domain-containing protein, partial [Phycisphaerae bacterium]|nr:PA14 domain-containing protein [Phycisphaerae bacterium]
MIRNRYFCSRYFFNRHVGQRLGIPATPTTLVALVAGFTWLVLSSHSWAAPAIVGASGTASMNQIELRFSEPLSPATANSITSYQARQGSSALAITAAALASTDPQRVILTTAAQTEGAALQVTVNGVTNRDGAPIAPNSSVAFTAYVFTPGLVKCEFYDLSAFPMEDRSISPLLSSPLFPYFPRETFYIRAMDTTYAYPDRTHENYGSQMTAVFIPPRTGKYTFYLRSDDASQLWFNPNGISETGAIKIAEETGCCHLFGELPSSTQSLVAGQRYFIKTLHRQGPEFSYCQVAVQFESDTTDPDHLLPIPYNSLGIYADPRNCSIAAQPAHDIVAVLPREMSNPMLLAADFSHSDGEFTVENNNPQGPWSYDASRQSWIALGHDSCGPTETSALISPTATVAKNGEVRLVFMHRYNFQQETDGDLLDGGQVRISVNDGPFNAVPATSFLQNGYTGTVIGSSALSGQMAFTSSHPEHGSGRHITSVARLGTFNAGDRIAVQFLAAWDECGSGFYPNWEIGKVYIAQSAIAISVDATGTMTNGEQVPVSYNWQINSGKGFVDADSTERVFWFIPSEADDKTQLRAILTIPGLSIVSAPVTLRVGHEPASDPGNSYVADCAADRPGLAVQLDGSKSFDPDGLNLTYVWSTNTPGLTLENPNTAKPILRIGNGFIPAETCEATLKVTNSLGTSVSAIATINTSKSQAKPTITLNGGDQQITCEGSGDNLYKELGATAVSACGQTLNVTIRGTTPDSRQVGTYVLTYDAADVFGNHPSPPITRTVVVQDPPAQLLNVPENFVMECKAIGGTPPSDPELAAFLAIPTTPPHCDPTEIIANDAPSLLPVGTTDLTWTVMRSGAPTEATATRTVTVQDTTPPTTSKCGQLTIAADADCSLQLPDLSDRIGASDVCSSQLTFTQDPPPGTVLPLGTHTVNFTISDSAEPPNTTSCSLSLEVTDRPVLDRLDDVSMTDTGDFSIDQLTVPVAHVGCGKTVEVTSAIVNEAAGECPTNKIVTVRWTATANDNTTDTFDQRILLMSPDSNG